MRTAAQHLDENTVVDFLAGSVPARDTHAVAVHLVTCAMCREVVVTCRRTGDGVASGSWAPAD